MRGLLHDYQRVFHHENRSGDNFDANVGGGNTYYSVSLEEGEKYLEQRLGWNKSAFTPVIRPQRTCTSTPIASRHVFEALPGLTPTTGQRNITLDSALGQSLVRDASPSFQAAKMKMKKSALLANFKSPEGNVEPPPSNPHSASVELSIWRPYLPNA